jgi:hypothetical protein
VAVATTRLYIFWILLEKKIQFMIWRALETLSAWSTYVCIGIVSACRFMGREFESRLSKMKRDGDTLGAFAPLFQFRLLCLYVIDFYAANIFNGAAR